MNSNMIQMNKLLLWVALMAVVVGCKNNDEQQAGESTTVKPQQMADNMENTGGKGEPLPLPDNLKETDTGVKYHFYKKGDGRVPPDGDYWLINLSYYDAWGEKIFSTADRGGAMPMMYIADNLSKNGSLEECLSMLANGDSAQFFISADTLFRYAYRRAAPDSLKGTLIRVEASIDGIYDAQGIAQYEADKARQQLEKEIPVIEEYLQKHGLQAKKTPEGLYYVIVEEGAGPHPAAGQIVRVNYTGKLLDGTVFDTSNKDDALEAGIYTPRKPYEPFRFRLGANQVIKGWDLGIPLLRPGGKAVLIIPSALAYGSRQMGKLIKPNSVLVFDVELVEIVDE